MRIHLETLLLAGAVSVTPLANIVLAAATHTQGRWQEVRLSSPEPNDPSSRACTIVQSDCEACAFHPDGTYDCSTPGIACIPTSWTCMTFDAAGTDATSPE